MSSGPKKKPTKAAGKQQQPSVQAAHAARQNGSSILSPFGQRLRALRERYLGPPFGEPGSDGRLQDETSKCESLTKRAILDAHDTEKLEAFGAGFSGLQESLFSAAVACYSDCFKLVEDNRSECDAPPPEFASSFTADCLSTFLRVTALDGAGESHETDSNGRVRWFVRHVCCDWSDDFPSSGLRAGGNLIFRLPQYLSDLWMVRAKVATQRRVEAPAVGFLSIEETETFILEKEQTLIKALRDAIADSRREALITPGKTSTATTAQPKEVWPGTARQLGDEVLEQYKNGTIAAKNERHALERACSYFVRKNGTPFKARVILQSLANRQNYERKGASDRSKALSALVKRFANAPLTSAPL